MKWASLPCTVVGLLYTTSVYPLVYFIYPPLHAVWTLVYGVLLTATLVTWLQTALVSPGTPEAAQVARLSPDQVTYCAKCCAFRPLQSHHCRICQRCILTFDHHCYWTGNCIGQRNKHLFMRYVVATSCYTLWITASIVWRLLGHGMFSGPSPWFAQCMDTADQPLLRCALFYVRHVLDRNTVWNELIIFGGLAVAASFFAGTIALLVFHLHLHRCGMTTFEFVVTRRPRQ